MFLTVKATLNASEQKWESLAASVGSQFSRHPSQCRGDELWHIEVERKKGGRGCFDFRRCWKSGKLLLDLLAKTSGNVKLRAVCAFDL